MRKVLVPGDIVMFAFMAVYRLLSLGASQQNKIHLAKEIKIFMNNP
jgi:hypothetical protein